MLKPETYETACLSATVGNGSHSTSSQKLVHLSMGYAGRCRKGAIEGA